MEKGKRDTELVANFVDGYAEGWVMAVRECYRNQLDIKYTERKKNNQSVYEWTQGPYFSFGEGHVFYDHPNGYLEWHLALKFINVACKVNSGAPTTRGKNGKIIDGIVDLIIYEPDKNSKSLIPVRTCRLFQKDFVNFLKTGKINEPDQCSGVVVPRSEI
jgi:hypothetical protein